MRWRNGDEGLPVNLDHGVSEALIGIDHDAWTLARIAYHHTAGGRDAFASECRVSLPIVRHWRSIIPLPRGSCGAHAVTRTPRAAHAATSFGPVSSLALSACRRLMLTPRERAQA